VTLRLQNVSFDCHDPSRLAAFWAEALGWRVTFADANEVSLEPPTGSPDEGVMPDFEFLLVPEDKVVKNRLHLDLRPSDQFAEVQRLIGLGAKRIDIGQGPECTWVVLADPEGNEFCVLRHFTDVETAAAHAP
jgi:hypothetical protein